MAFSVHPQRLSFPSVHPFSCPLPSFTPSTCSGCFSRGARREAVEGKTALAAAASIGHVGCARALLARGADPFVPTLHGRGPVFLAAAGGHADVLRLLLETIGTDRRMEMRRPDSVGITPVMVAAANGMLTCLKILTGDGTTGMIAATRGVWTDRLTSEWGVDALDREGRTALMHACLFGQVKGKGGNTDDVTVSACACRCRSCKGFADVYDLCVPIPR